MVDALRLELERRNYAVAIAGMGSEEVVKDYPWAVHAHGLKTGRMARRALTEFAISVRLACRLVLAMLTRRLARPDLIVLFTPSLFLSLTAAALKSTTSCRVYMVQRDIVPDWLVASGHVKLGIATSILFALKNFSLRRADRIGIECAENFAFFPVSFHSKIEILHNWRDFDPGLDATEPASPHAVLIYGGRVGQVQGFDRLLRPFLKLAHPTAQLRIHCDERGRGEIESMGLPVDDLRRIDIRPMLDEKQFLVEATKAWFGIVTLSPQMQTHNIPGKMLAYLAAGIPVVGIGPRDAALGQSIRKLGVGHYMDASDENGILDALRELVDDPAGRARAKSAVKRARSVFSTASATDMILDAMSGPTR